MNIATSVTWLLGGYCFIAVGAASPCPVNLIAMFAGGIFCVNAILYALIAKNERTGVPNATT